MVARAKLRRRRQPSRADFPLSAGPDFEAGCGYHAEGLIRALEALGGGHDPHRRTASRSAP
jgi:hypothetical protein